MNVYLAGNIKSKVKGVGSLERVWILTSFYDIPAKTIPDYIFGERHILDSGAFSFFGGKTVDWEAYTRLYAAFIKRTNQKLFFEMDIDRITSTIYAERLRTMIEDITGQQTIPVWRPMRGIEYWYRMCEEYKYVAISASGMYDSAWTRTKAAVPVLQKMLAIARERGVKVHGLGYTNCKTLPVLPFASIDSTTWLSAGRYGIIYNFVNNTLQPTKQKKQRIADNKTADRHNFTEWVKFQQYAEQFL